MTDAPKASFEQALTRIWAQSAPLIEARVAAVEEAATALLDGPLAPDARESAGRAAHSLAGTVGTFGFAEASALAREAEMLLDGAGDVSPAAVLRLATIAVELRRRLIGAALPPAGAAGATVSTAGTSVPTASDPAPVSAEPLTATVVAVDDDVAMLELLRAALGERGIDVYGVSDPSGAATKIAERRPDLVLLDMEMPGLDGLALCRQLRAQPATAETPIMFHTSHDEATMVRAMFAAGADDHMVKPAPLDTLAARIAGRLARQRHSRPVDATNVDVAIIDDDGVLTTLLAHAISTRGYSAVVIPEGTEAVAKLCGASPEIRPAVILLDVSLPGLDGLAVLRALARDGVARRAHVIMLTARSVESEVLQALEAGARDHIAKPFSVPVLMQRLRRAIERDAGGR